MTESNTLAHIEKIHSTRKGIENKIYKDEKDNRYIGLKNGHLQKILTVGGEVTGDLKNLLINGIGKYTKDDIIDSIKKTNFIEAELKITSIDRFKELIYTNGTLTQTNIWADNKKIIKLYQVDYTYTGEDLTQSQTKRISDGFTYTKDLTYENGNLVSIKIT